MEKHLSDCRNRLLSSSVLFLLLVCSYSTHADTPFQIVWRMDLNLAGSSSSSNFSPDDAFLVGAHPHSLPAILYYSIGGGDYAYGTTYWLPGSAKYLNFSFSVSTYEYNLNSVSFRVRRSGDGPADVTLRSSLDGFTSDLSSFHLSADGVFYTVTVPLGLTSLSGGVTFRLFGHNAVSNFGVLYVDQIVVNGSVTSIVLPVTITYFKAGISDQKVRLTWETASEYNSKEFVIERSQDLREFEEIGRVPAGGESLERLQYSFMDQGPPDGAIYYRLRMVDKSGAFAFSKTVDVVIRSGVPGFLISPNPSNPFLIRVKTNMVKPEAMELIAVNGGEISIIYVYMDGNFMDLIPNGALCSGIYVLSLKLEGRWQRQKVLIP